MLTLIWELFSFFFNTCMYFLINKKKCLYWNDDIWCLKSMICIIGSLHSYFSFLWKWTCINYNICCLLKLEFKENFLGSWSISLSSAVVSEHLRFAFCLCVKGVSCPWIYILMWWCSLWDYIVLSRHN